MVYRQRSLGEYQALLAKALHRVKDLEEEVETLQDAFARLATKFVELSESKKGE